MTVRRTQPGCVAVVSPVSGSVWKISSAPGQAVKAGDTLVLVESMKMELSVTAPVDGIVMQLRCARAGGARCTNLGGDAPERSARRCVARVS